MDNLDLVGMFEGLNREQAQDLTERITKAVNDTYTNFKTGANKMSDNFWDNLTPEEAKEAQAEFAAVQKKIESGRVAKQQAQWREDYIKEMVANQGSKKAHIQKQIKARWQARGLDVDAVDFTHVQR